ncbi:MAG: hypothetical protein R3220_08895 [Balneolaceae bacterium]|nr:hypothetical protein [Balneolaceae bacterium]
MLNDPPSALIISFESWKANLKEGHTFVSSGPIIDLKVNGMIPGDELKQDKGNVLRIEATAFGHTDMAPLEILEIVAHGQVIAE